MIIVFTYFMIADSNKDRKQNTQSEPFSSDIKKIKEQYSKIAKDMTYNEVKMLLNSCIALNSPELVSSNMTTDGVKTEKYEWNIRQNYKYILKSGTLKILCVFENGFLKEKKQVGLK